VNPSIRSSAYLGTGRWGRSMDNGQSGGGGGLDQTSGTDNGGFVVPHWSDGN